jgi:predicted ester cyclase
MSAQDNKANVQRIVEEIFNNKKLALIDEYIASDVIDHSAPPGLPPGIEGYRLKLGMFTNAFPDLHITYEKMIAEGDMVAGRFTLTGTQQGDFAGIPATGKQVSVTGHDFVRVVDGIVAEHWVEMDTLGMMQQLGVVPTPEAA